MMLISRKLLRTVLITLVALGLLTCAGFKLVARAVEGEEPSRTPAWGTPVRGLACAIRTSKAVYAPGEEIPLDILLRSEVASMRVMVPRVTCLSYGANLPLEIAGPDGRHVYTGPVLEPPLPPTAGCIMELYMGEISGAWSSGREPLRIVPAYWSLTKPGRYTIRLRYTSDNAYMSAGKMVTDANVWNGTLLSNTVVFEISGK